MYIGSDEHKQNLQKARKAAKRKVECMFCSEERTIANIKRHENSCYLNPKNTRLCEVCQQPVKHYKESVTCSYACANTLFRSGPEHPNWKESSYQSTCFHYHKKKCIVCEEVRIVEVHHLDEDKTNNNPSNLAPLCPTHHQYWHSRHKHLIEKEVMSYMKEWSGTLVRVQRPGQTHKFTKLAPRAGLEPAT